MRKLCAALMMCLLCLTICLSALAERTYFSGERNNGSRPALAQVGGQVYGLSGYEGLLGAFTPAVERWSPAGERTRTGQNAFLNSEIGYIAGAGDALLIVREEKGWLELLDPTASITLQAELWYPATGRRVRVAEGAIALQGRLYDRRDGQLQQLSADGSEVLAAWPGKPAGYWDSFILLEDGEKRMVLETATGACTDVTALGLALNDDAQAAVEDGVLYHLEDTALTAISLTDGTRRKLLTFPEETYQAFVMDAARIILLGRPYRGDPIWSAVYDRATLAQLLTFTHMTNPIDALLTGDTLYLRSPYSGAFYSREGSWRRESSASIIDLTTGGEIYWALNE